MAGWRKGGGLLAGFVTTIALTVAAPATAQVAGQAAGNSAAPAPVPAASPTAALPVPVPPAPVFVLPDPMSTATPRPTPTSTPIPRTTASASQATRATPTPRATASASPRPTATPSPVGTNQPTPVVTTSPLTPTPPPAPVPAKQEADGIGAIIADWPILPFAIGVVLLAIGWAILRRRRAARLAGEEEGAAVAQAEPVAALAAIGRARLAISFRPIRAGLNLLSAVSENEIVVANIGDAPADNIRLLTQLTSAHAGQDAELAAIYAAPIGRPEIPAFTLAAGEERAITAVAALPRDALVTLTAAGRPMFVPIVAVNLTYVSGAHDGQTAQAFAIGVERVDSAKLAPFWLDAPPRMTDQIAARPHATALER